MNSYFIESNDFVAIETEVKKIIKEEHFEDAEKSIYDMQETELQNAVEDLDTYNFLSPKKIVIIRNIDSIKASDTKESTIEHLIKYIKSPSEDNLLIIEKSDEKESDEKQTTKKETKTSEKKSINLEKELKKHCKTITIDLNSKSFIKNALKGYKVSQNTISLLDEYCLGDFTKIESECNKLKNYKLDTLEITEEDVKELVEKKLGDSKTITYAFAKSLGERDVKKALEDYHELLKYNKDPLSIIGLLSSQLRIIYQVKLLSRRGLRDKEIASMLGEKDFRITKTKELTPLYTESEVLELMQKLSDMDLRIKTTDTNPTNELELFITNI